MQNELKVALIQTDLVWENPVGNRDTLTKKIHGINEAVDLIVLPEMFSTGFTMEADKLAEPPNSKTYRWMAQMAAQTGSMIIGSYIIKDGTDRFNRLHAVTPDGNHHAYDKRHLFRMAEEHKHYSSGNKKIIIEWKGWKILPLVCYDLRFPVWSRNYPQGKELQYDTLIFVANWPAARVSAWDSLLKARAIENLSYSVGLNRVGDDGKGVLYNGHSGIYDPKGEKLLFMDDKEDIQTISLSMSELEAYRNKFPAHFDGDSFEIK